MKTINCFNFISNFTIKDYPLLPSDKFLKLALPILSLAPDSPLVTSIGLAAYEITHSYATEKQKINFKNLSFIVGSFLLGRISPASQIALSTALCLCTHLSTLYTELKQQHWQNSAYALIPIAEQLLHAFSYAYKSPALQALSLLAQGMSDMSKAWKELHEGQTLDTAIFSALAALRVYKAYAHLKPFYFRYLYPTPPEPVIVCVTSPFDSNGILTRIKQETFRSVFSRHLRIVEVEPRSLNELEHTFQLLQSQSCQITHVFFGCHGIPIAIRPTSFLIKMPTERAFNDDYFLNHSEARRIPKEEEYESFDRFVSILRKALGKKGKVTLLSCSSAQTVPHPEKNFAHALASRLPGIQVTGTKYDFTEEDCSLEGQVFFSKRSIDIRGHGYKKYLFPRSIPFLEYFSLPFSSSCSLIPLLFSH